ncbi:MAG: UPF0489 family protein [Candidatus Gracilibacteria bacterium]|nr:UPF0489 family protein [Candidatus Gracilibacteria bacterium]
MYSKPFFIEKPVGNNAFSFDKRDNKKLFVTSLIDGNLSDLVIGENIVFEDFDFDFKLVSYAGLKNFVRFNYKGKEIIIFDNHNHAIYFWCDAYSRGIIGKNSNLIHIDEHSDMRDPEIYPENLDNLKEIFDYTNFTLNVGNYIIPAQKFGLLRDIYQIRSEANIEDFSFENLDKAVSNILNIDVDFFSPGLDYMNYDNKIAFVKKSIEKADFITIATSPFFIDQELAIKVIKEILG